MRLRRRVNERLLRKPLVGQLGGKSRIMDRQQLMKKLDKAWAELRESYAGLSDAQLTQSGIMGDWSVKDSLAHVTTWEEEALKYLPLISQGGRPAQYSIKYG